MEIPLQIVFKDIDSSDAIEERIRERVRRLERLHRNIVSCRVAFEALYRNAEGFRPPVAIQVELHIPKRTLVAKEVETQHDAKDDNLVVVNRAFYAVERRLEDEVRIMRGDVKRHERARPPEPG